MGTRAEARAAARAQRARIALVALVALALAALGVRAAWSGIVPASPGTGVALQPVASFGADGGLAAAAATPSPVVALDAVRPYRMPEPGETLPRPPVPAPTPGAPAPGVPGVPGAPAPSPSPALSPSPAPPRSATLAFTGDLLPHTPVLRAAEGHGAAAGVPYDFRPLLAPIAPTLQAADLALCHLEVPLTTDLGRVSSYPQFNAPADLAVGIADAGWDGCSTASNHSVDQGFGGVVATLDALDRAGVPSVGTARSEQESVGPEIYAVGDVLVGHLSYTYGLNGLPLPPGAPWAVDLIDPAVILADAADTRARGAEVVVVSLHWGAEYRTEPTDEQRALAAQLAASPDVDLLVGHHAHVVQPIERIGTTVVVYGLGNFLSGQGASCCGAATQDGVVARVTFAEQPPGSARRFLAAGVTVAPTWVDRPGYRVLPVLTLLADPATPPDLAAALAASRDRTLAAVGPSVAVPTP